TWGPTWTEVRGPAEGQPLRGVEVDMRDCSDVAQTLAVVAACAATKSRITGIGFIRGKETDRVGAVVRELKRLGVHATEEADGLCVEPSPGGLRPARVQTYEDHRMAMSFALAGLVADGIEIEDPGCVAKTLPDFFRRLEALGVGVDEAGHHGS
ncbi:MAG: 3-phosphoshikimate 1-carboxyvinyltransferase, partial [Nannocystaceae bacterium]